MVIFSPKKHVSWWWIGGLGWWFGILRVPLSNNPFHKGIPGIQDFSLATPVLFTGQQERLKALTLAANVQPNEQTFLTQLKTVGRAQ